MEITDLDKSSYLAELFFKIIERTYSPNEAFETICGMDLLLGMYSKETIIEVINFIPTHHWYKGNIKNIKNLLVYFKSAVRRINN